MPWRFFSRFYRSSRALAITMICRAWSHFLLFVLYQKVIALLLVNFEGMNWPHIMQIFDAMLWKNCCFMKGLGGACSFFRLKPAKPTRNYRNTKRAIYGAFPRALSLFGWQRSSSNVLFTKQIFGAAHRTDDRFLTAARFVKLVNFKCCQFK